MLCGGGGESRIRPIVLFALAQAYETWWSLSRASQDDPFVGDPAVYREGAEEARVKAIAYYERVAEVAPKSAPAVEAGSRLPRLRRGIDTHQRRYQCVYE